MLTCYDYPNAKLMDAYVDVLLVGDSVGTNVLGYDSENDVTVSDICHHTKAVKRGASTALILSDMPFNSYQTPAQALDTARQLLQAGADAVKCEGVQNAVIQTLVANNIPVVGHLGLTPQFHEKKQLQAKVADTALQCIEDALSLERLGIEALVIELVPTEVAKLLSELLTIPVIGIAAGKHCDGQVQVLPDILGLSPVVYKHAKVYDRLAATKASIYARYQQDVKAHTLIQDDQESHMKPEQYHALLQHLETKGLCQKKTLQ